MLARCGSCAYDLRGGSESDRCPECGAAVLVALGDFLDPLTLGRARELLEQAAIKASSTTDDGSFSALGPWTGTSRLPATTIWVSRPDLERAQEALRVLE